MRGDDLTILLCRHLFMGKGLQYRNIGKSFVIRFHL